MIAREDRDINSDNIPNESQNALLKIPMFSTKDYKSKNKNLSLVSIL